MKKLGILTLFFLAGCTSSNGLKTIASQSGAIVPSPPSIIDVKNCNVKNYNPEQDCAITKYLEETKFSGYRMGGVTFCTYKLIAEDGPAQYILPICEEYYVVDYKLYCDTPELKNACLNAGLDGSIGDNFEAGRLPLLQDGIQRCDKSCSYVAVNPKILNVGSGYAGATYMKITKKTDGTLDVWQPADFSTDEEDLKKNIPEKYLQKYHDYSQEGGPYKDGKLSNWNTKRAEDYFGLRYDPKMIFDE